MKKEGGSKTFEGADAPSSFPNKCRKEIKGIKKKKKINIYEKKEKKPCVNHKWGMKSFGGRRVCDTCGKVESF